MAKPVGGGMAASDADRHYGRTKMGKYLVVVLLLGICGCGGGGGGTDGDWSTLEGVANINEATSRPRVGIVEPWEDTFRSVGAPVRLSPVPTGYGWRDVNWVGLRLPPAVVGKRYYIVAFNDLDRSNSYKTSELLGFFDGYLVYGNDLIWWLVRDDGTYTRALYCRGKDIYITATYPETALPAQIADPQKMESVFVDRIKGYK